MPVWSEVLLLAVAAATSSDDPPLTVAAARPLEQPSLAERAVSLADVGELPATPRTFHFLCVLPDGHGKPDLCFDRDQLSKVDAGRQVPSISDDLENRWREIARRRITSYRFPRQAIGPSGKWPTILIDETVANADRPTLPPDLGLIDDATVDPDSISATIMADYFPPEARWANVSMRVRARCRVLADLSLYCSEAKPEQAAGMGPGPTDAAFEQATIRLLARAKVLSNTRSGRNPIGHDVNVTIRWAVSD